MRAGLVESVGVSRDSLGAADLAAGRLRILSSWDIVASYRHISHGFDPVFDESSRILVLGSFPSVLSRRNDFYYGNPQNRFWRVMAACLGRPVPPNEGELLSPSCMRGVAVPEKGPAQSITAAPPGSDPAFAPASALPGIEPAAVQASDSAPEPALATLEQSIAAKRSLLLRGGIALWDVIESCDIKGSSDASIKNVIPVDVSRVLSGAKISAVICNGATAGRLYRRYLEWEVGLAAHVLPSTSPANAAWSLERLTQRWQDELSMLFEAVRSGEMPAVCGVGRTVAPASDAGEPATPAVLGEPAVPAVLGELAAPAAPAFASASDAPAPAPATAPASVTADAPAPVAVLSEPPDSRPAVDYAVVRVPTPPASNWAVHKSMQGNKRKDTKPELLMREKLREAGLGGYRLQWKVPGHPDISWPGKRVAVEVRGCYWHRCPHCKPSVPKRNVWYWEAKFARNVQRDAENLAALEAMGWRVHVVWECQLKKDALAGTMGKLLPQLALELGKPLKIPAAPADEAAPAASESPAPAVPVSVVPADEAAPSAPVDEAAPARKRHFMYVLECGDASLYTGYTTDVQARLAVHRAGKGAKYTRTRGPLNVLAWAEFATKHEAMSAEARFKRLSRDRKDELLAKASAPGSDFATILREEFGL